MKHRPALLILLFSLYFLEGNAQEQRKITLNEAIDLSLANNKQLKISQAKIEEAAADYREAVEKKLPNASVSGSYLRFNSPNIDVKSKSSNSGGGSTQGDNPDVSQAVYGMLNISLPVYTGGKIKYGIESSALLKKASELDAETDKEEVIQTTIEAFANLYKAGTAVQLVRQNLARSEQRVKELENLEKNGLLARNDLLKARLQSSNIELSLLDAGNNLELANLNMNLMLGLPRTTLLVPDTGGVNKKEDNRVLEDYLAAAGANRKDFSAIDYRKQAAASGVKAAKAEKLPSLQLTGGYIAADIPNFFSVTNAVNVGVGVSYNISSLWKTRSRVQQADAKVKQLTLAESSLQDNITLQVSRSYLSLLSNRKKISVTEKALEQASENYHIVKNKFDNSLATLSDLLEADLAQLQAEMAYTLSRADAFVAYNQLLLSAGILSHDLNK